MPTATANQGAAGAAVGAGGAAAAAAGTTAGAAAANSTPSTPVKVPSAAASYTPATLDPDLRSQINMVLIRDGHVGRIQDYLLHILNADASNWPATVQAHALQLLRSGEYTNFPALMDRVMDDIRQDTAFRDSNGKNGTNGTNGVNGTNSAKNGTSKAGASKLGSLALPQSVIDEALRATRESLDMVCEIEE
ncbi:hypothetical protein SEUCBS139899_000855 [Sporothrix eucalyptigena]|uniref:Uncharacterized protein n=1 Tax=Sporothrix eucalyptigena TaxID=1812306 RepID=A0ABP0C0A6_9PEZI